jgi:DNA replication licensing factor MCM5
VRVPGIIIAANAVQAKATRIHVLCRQCGRSANLALKPGLTGLQLPRTCPGYACPRSDAGAHKALTCRYAATRPETEAGRGVQCPLDPYVISPDQSSYVDQQTLKLQEAPDQVPVGELPRSMLVTVDRYAAAPPPPSSAPQRWH